MTGEQGVDLVQRLQPRAAIPVHYDDYRLFTSPLAEFTDELTRRGLADRLRVAARGETVDLTDLVVPDRVRADESEQRRRPDGRANR